MKNSRQDIPECVRHKYQRELNRRLSLGFITLAEMSQSDRDLIHMNEDEKCLAYWTQEKELAILADDCERIVYADGIRRRILVLTHKPAASDTDCPRLALLDNIQQKVRAIPSVHR